MTSSTKHRSFSRRAQVRARRVAVAILLFCVGATSIHAAPQWAVAIFPSGAEFSLEIAADPESRALGYMFRDKISAGEGMLFVFDAPGSYTFWMKNCRVPLDIIWLDESFRVVDIAHDRQPCPPEAECPGLGPMRAARYVIEVAGGTAKREGLERGDRLTVLAEAELP
jgi:uncharacterized membrane protein (UPF0127 family)